MLTPMPHQVTGAEFLAARGFALLADDMGVGKTKQIIMAADQIGATKILVVCPAVVKQMWAKVFLSEQQIVRTIIVAEGRPKTPPVAGVTIVSHASFAETASIEIMLQGAPYDLIIIDESHLIRRFDAARTRSILAPAPTAAAITPSSMDPPGAWTWSSRLWCLTGTPIVNSAADLWPLAYGPMRMPVSWWDWGNQFCDEMRQDGFGGIRPIGLKNIPALADTMRPHVLRRTLPGIGIILPPLTINQVPVPVDQAALARAMADLEGWTPARLALALELRDELHDAALARVRKVLGLAKVQVVARHVDQMLKNGEGPVVVFFQHTQVREELFTELSTRCGYKVSWIDGKVSRAQVTAAEDWFSMGWLDVILVQTDAGGVGISLVRSNRCVIAELPWTSVAMFQGVARLHRIRQERPVLAEVIRAHGCWLEEALAGAVSKKQRAAEQFLTALETFS